MWPKPVINRYRDWQFGLYHRDQSFVGHRPVPRATPNGAAQSRQEGSPACEANRLVSMVLSDGPVKLCRGQCSSGTIAVDSGNAAVVRWYTPNCQSRYLFMTGTGHIFSSLRTSGAVAHHASGKFADTEMGVRQWSR